MYCKYPCKNPVLIVAAFLLLIISSCKKESVIKTPAIVDATPTTIGLYEADSSIYKELIIPVTKIGTKTVDYDFVFDTGSGGMVIDASGILPASMITGSGITITGDSTVVDGITITNQTSTIEYGDDNSTLTKVYGNLAYAAVTIGDDNGNVVVKRLPFFMYYKAVAGDGTLLAAHDFDTFGVSQQYDVSFANNVQVTSPFTFFDPGTGLTKGMKLAKLGTAEFSYNGTYVPGVLTLGLTSADLASAGFSMNNLTFYAGEGYSPDIAATVTYNSKKVSASVLFDTGTDPYNYIEDNTASGDQVLLLNNSTVSIATSSAFNYSYVTSAADNLTYVENPSVSGENTTIFGLEFFLDNEYLLDYTNHKLGVKNN